MFPVAAFLGAAGSIAGGLIGKSGQDNANAANAQMAREQMQFQERMSNTSYQRAVADLRAAGLNPMLAYQQGGASAPTGASAQMQNSSAALGAGVSSAASSAMAMQSQRAQIAQAQASVAKTHAETVAQDIQNGFMTQKLEMELESLRAGTALSADRLLSQQAERMLTILQRAGLETDLETRREMNAAELRERLSRANLNLDQLNTNQLSRRLMGLEGERRRTELQTLGALLRADLGERFARTQASQASAADTRQRTQLGAFEFQNLRNRDQLNRSWVGRSLPWVNTAKDLLLNWRFER